MAAGNREYHQHCLVIFTRTHTNRTLSTAPVEVETDLSAGAQQAELIDGKAIAQTIRKEVAAEVAKLHDKYGKVLFGQ